MLINIIFNRRFLIATISLLFLCISPFVYISLFTVPIIDDYCIAHFFKALGALGLIKFNYLSWSGRYIPNIYSFLHPAVYGLDKYYGIASIVTIVGMIFFTYFLFKKIISIYMSSNTDEIQKSSEINEVNQRLFSLMWSLLFVLFFLSRMNSLSEGIYWWPGIVNYTLVYLYLVVFMRCFLSQKVTSQTFAIIAAIFIIGSNETVMGYFFVPISCFYFLQIINQFKQRKNEASVEKNSILSKRVNWNPIFVTNILMLLFLILSTLIVVMAPGNAGRSGVFTHEKDISKIVIGAFIGFSKHLYLWIFKSNLIWFLILLTPLFITIIKVKHEVLKFLKHFWLILFFMLLSLYIVFLIPQYFMDAPPPGRTLNIILVLFSFNLILLYWSSLFHWIYNKNIYLTSMRQKFKSFLYQILKIPVLTKYNLIYWFILWGCILTMFCQGSFRQLREDILNQRHTVYYNEQLSFIDQLKAKDNSGPVVISNKIEYVKTLGIVDLSDPKFSWTHHCYELYFNKKLINQ